MKPLNLPKRRKREEPALPPSAEEAELEHPGFIPVNRTAAAFGGVDTGLSVFDRSAAFSAAAPACRSGSLMDGKKGPAGY